MLDARVQDPVRNRFRVQGRVSGPGLTFAAGKDLLVLGARVQDPLQLQLAQLALRDDRLRQRIPQRVVRGGEPDRAAVATPSGFCYRVCGARCRVQGLGTAASDGASHSGQSAADSMNPRTLEP